MHKHIILLAATLFVILSFSSCNVPTQETNPPKHALVGAWLATDGTIFNFHDDGTFHGIDFRKKEIWGNWVTLSPARIGFQSLLHDSSYQPQYAIIDPKNKNEMDYIVTGGTNFIHAKRIATEKANTTIEMVAEPQVHSPQKTEPEPAASP